MKPFLIILQTLIPNQKRKVLSSGFTLVELLAATVMSSIVISSLLFVMIDIARTSAAETARKNTLQDMRRALEFMTDDLKEAVYVYTGDQLENRDILDGNDDNDGIKDILNLPDSEELEPILVFWKLEDVPYDPNNDSLPTQGDCDSLSDQQQQECEQLRISQRTYTLVAYVQDDDPTDRWDGESVIYRYQLRKYEEVSTLTEETSYEEADPVQDSSFANWPYNTEGDSPSLPSGYKNPPTDDSDNPEIDRQVSAALVDFVDEENEENEPNNEQFSKDDVSCPNGFNRTPEDQAENETDPSTSSSFYACVEQAETEDEDDVAIPADNATVIVHLRGNPNGRVSFDLGDSNLPTLNSSAVLRGSTPN